MFGVSFLEIAVIGLIALVVVGPQKLPAMMRTAGEWVGKLRRMTSDMRKQTGIDDILREEGIDGVAELRTLLRGGGLRNAALSLGQANHPSTHRGSMNYTEAPDPLLEFPVEGVDAGGALPDDLFSEHDKDGAPEERHQASDAPSTSPANNGSAKGDLDPHANPPQLSTSTTGPLAPGPPPGPDSTGNPNQQE